MSSHISREADCEYVVVGSGAGGGTVAARLAEAGRTVVLLEAGGDPRLLAGGDPVEPDYNRLPFDYDVPVFHAFASENDAMRWNFFVRHYGNDQVQHQDPKYCEYWDGKRVDGVLYPRAGALGGCTAHNAMIFVYPHNADWDNIASLTGDESWRAENMRTYFERVENCHHRLPYRLLSWLGINSTRHGWKGWLHTETAFPLSVLRDCALIRVILASASKALGEIGQRRNRLRWLLKSQLDPNDWRMVKEDAVGIWYTPLATHKHARNGSRERVLEVAKKYPGRLKIELNALATCVKFDKDDRAIGVKYSQGERLYRAHGRVNDGSSKVREISVSREVILAGGAFNSPQLLMLSGIGPRDVLDHWHIPVRVDLPGVGANLQDRYEISVVNRMKFKEWEVFKGAKFAAGDPLFRRWSRKRGGVYTTNGTALALFKRSAPARPLPDLFLLAVLGRFEGYFPDYSKQFAEGRDYLSWIVLKAHTNNRRGNVTLRSADPCDTPQINFRYFEEGTEDGGQDLDSVVEGVRFARTLTAKLKKKGLIAEEELPGEQLESDDDLKNFIRYNAWGHHASCTCAIGPREANGVLGGDFRVHGTKNLRVVDASVFPRIPGFFIVSAVYMIAEKAADAILADAERDSV